MLSFELFAFVNRLEGGDAIMSRLRAKVYVNVRVRADGPTKVMLLPILLLPLLPLLPLLLLLLLLLLPATTTTPTAAITTTAATTTTTTFLQLY